MGNEGRSLGGRLPLLRPEEMSVAQRRVFDRVEAHIVPWAKSAGFVGTAENGAAIGPFNSQLFSPDIDASYLDFLAAERTHSSLDERVREIVILAVGAVWQADYELYAHRAAGRAVGLSDAALGDAASGRPSDELNGAEHIAYRFARKMSLERRVDNDLYAEAERAFGRRGLADMMYLIGIYHLVCGFLNAFEVPAPDQT